MRIISGIYRSRKIDMVNKNTTRETTDKVRGAIFNIINPYTDGGVVLDLFAGSGAMGIEAISRGAEIAYFNDIDSEAQRVIEKNLKTLNIGNYKLLKNDFHDALRNFRGKGTKFDIVFLDPPYEMNVYEEIISYMLDFNLLNPNALIICEYKKELVLNVDLPVLKEKTYGIRKVTVYCNGDL